MENNNQIQSTEFYVRNMLCRSCIRVVKMELENAGITVDHIRLGWVAISYDTSKITYNQISELLTENGFGIVIEREKVIIEQIKQAVVELVHEMNNVDSIVRKSEYLVERINMSYQQISKLFSKHEPITLEKYIIANKIERIKELIITDEYTLSEIAYMMDYNSVQYLSTQFKNTTGVSVSDYKKSGNMTKTPINELCDKKT